MATSDKAITFYKQFGEDLNKLVLTQGFKVEDTKPAGRNSRYYPNQREFRLQLINPERDTREDLITFLDTQLKYTSGISNIKFNPISPNSSKFSSYSFTIDGFDIDVVISRGSNNGENYELSTVSNLKEYFDTRQDEQFAKLVKQMEHAWPPFADVEIQKVEQRKGSTKKEGIAIEKLGEVIGDIVLTDRTNQKWYVSLKDINGLTFSAYSGAASLFNADGVLQYPSAGADFLSAFGVDLNKVQQGFDERKTPPVNRQPEFKTPKFSSTNLIPIFERAWGMNYFYVKRERIGFSVFWLDRPTLKKLTNNIRIDEIRYPSRNSKQITIKCSNKYMQYTIEIRNSKRGEYPNDIKFKNIKKVMP